MVLILRLRLFWFVWMTYRNNVTATFRFYSSLWYNFYCVTITFFICSKLLRFFGDFRITYIAAYRSSVVKSYLSRYIILAYQIFLNLISRKFNFSFCEINTLFYNELLYLFCFSWQKNDKLQQITIKLVTKFWKAICHQVQKNLRNRRLGL